MIWRLYLILILKFFLILFKVEKWCPMLPWRRHLYPSKKNSNKLVWKFNNIFFQPYTQLPLIPWPVQYERSLSSYFISQYRRESVWQSGHFILNFFISRQLTLKKWINIKLINVSLLLRKTPFSGVNVGVF